MDIKAIFMSDYTDHAVLANGELPEGLLVIHKPSSAQALAKKLREVLTACRARDRSQNAHELRLATAALVDTGRMRTRIGLVAVVVGCSSTSHYTVDSRPHGAYVYVDGVQVGTTPI